MKHLVSLGAALFVDYKYGGTAEDDAAADADEDEDADTDTDEEAAAFCFLAAGGGARSPRSTDSKRRHNVLHTAR